MSHISFADVAHKTITFDTEDPAGALVLRLCDSRWCQRLRDISQTSNMRLVYMFSEHSRFGHSLGVAFLAHALLKKLALSRPDAWTRYAPSVCAAAMLHDIGHLAPGSHSAWRTWFPGTADRHEALAVRIINEDPQLQDILAAAGPEVPELVCGILSESPSLPPWTWEVISGGGWNADRGNWCIVDSILAGVSYGKYNIDALTESITITPSGHLALRENRLDAMMHFAVSRHAMYRQLYQHRVLLSADALSTAVSRRARDLGGAISFADDDMRRALDAGTPEELPLATIDAMRESWWRYHLMRWARSDDHILADLSERVINRRLLKTVRIRSDEDPHDLKRLAEEAVRDAGYDPRYYLQQVSTFDIQSADSRQSMLVELDDGQLSNLPACDPLFNALLLTSKESNRSWLIMPGEAKARLGRER